MERDPTTKRRETKGLDRGQRNEQMAARDEASLPIGFGTRPWLVQATRRKTVTFVDPSDRSVHESVIPEVEGKICLGCVLGGAWLMLLDESTGESFLLSLATSPARPKIPLPRLPPPFGNLGVCVVLESPGHPDFTVAIAYDSVDGERLLLHCCPRDQEWTRLLLASPLEIIYFHGQILNYKGKIYAFTSSTNAIVVDLVDGVVRARRMGTIGDDEKESRSFRYTPHLVESCGDLFVVLVEDIGRFNEDGVLAGILVYRLDDSDSENMSWRRVENIGDDRVFLISGGYGFSCSAMASRMQGNCVYLVWSCCDCEGFYKVCLDDMTASFHQILPQPTPRRAFWSVPAGCSIQAIEAEELASTNYLPPKKVNLQNDPDKHHEDVRAISLPPWHDLPLDLLELVASNLSLVDRLRFPAVCKSWSMVSNPIEQAKVWPWLMHCSRQDGMCKMLDPLRGKEYTLKVETFETDVMRDIFRSSKDGWLIMSRDDAKFDDINLINPFTQDIVEFMKTYDYKGISLSVAPSSPDCVLFGINNSFDGDSVGVYTLRHEGDEWIEQEYNYQVSFLVARNNPVFFNGMFYCLGRKGNLGVFDPRSGDPSTAWTVLEKPEPIHAEMEFFGYDHEGVEFCYLVELGGEMVSVFMRNTSEPPQVFKLDETKMAWTEVDDIGGAALFLDSKASYGFASPEGGHGNRIYFLRFSEDGKQPAFYDMETKIYYPSFYDLKQPLRSVWVVPNLHVDNLDLFVVPKS
ncbi:hypothetical protein ACP70R_000969 [Stipagrostis hirtigluma subsp. patula]